MEGIAVSVSTGVMNSLLSKLSILLSDQYEHLKGVRKDIEFLSRELAHMSAALETLANLEKLEPQTKVWRDMVRETAYDVEDCIDIFIHNVGKGDDKDGLLDKILGKVRKLRDYYKLGSKIQELKARVVEQSESRARYKIDEAAATPAVPRVDPRVQACSAGLSAISQQYFSLTTNQHQPPTSQQYFSLTTNQHQLPANRIGWDAQRLVGIDGPRDEITKLLLEEGDHYCEKLKVVSIVGFGGLGKTTLANQVYNTIKNEFQCKAFVSVCRSPNIPKILKDILSGVGYGSMNISDDVDKLIMTLTEHLTNMRYALSETTFV